MTQLNAIVDSREPGRVVELLRRHDDVSSVEKDQLTVGDIVLGPGDVHVDTGNFGADVGVNIDLVAIERKSPADFVRSIQDRRLEDQIDRMYEWFGATNSYIIVEGSVNDLIAEPSGIPENGIYGYIGSLAARWQMVPLFAGYPTTEIELLTRVARKHFEETNRVVRSPDSTPKRKNDAYYLRMLMELDGIGRKTANNIADELGNPEDLIHADTEQLQEIDGIGKKRAECIRTQIWNGE